MFTFVNRTKGIVRLFSDPLDMLAQKDKWGSEAVSYFLFYSEIAKSSDRLIFILFSCAGLPVTKNRIKEIVPQFI